MPSMPLRALARPRPRRAFPEKLPKMCLEEAGRWALPCCVVATDPGSPTQRKPPVAWFKLPVGWLKLPFGWFKLPVGGCRVIPDSRSPRSTGKFVGTSRRFYRKSTKSPSDSRFVWPKREWCTSLHGTNQQNLWTFGWLVAGQQLDEGTEQLTC